MARPTKKGIDYFSFDVDFFEDEKIEPISGEFGVKGEIIVVRLLCAIYRNGYFIQWTEQLKMSLANRCKVSHTLIDLVIKRLVKWNFFDEKLFDSTSILTSNGIQTRYKEATRKRKINYEKLEYWLIFDEKTVSGGSNALASEFRAEKTPQSKVNKSKVITSSNEEVKKTTNTREENLEQENSESQNSTFKNFEKEKEKSSAKKEKELEGIKNFLVENGADYADVSEWFKKRISENKATTRYFAEKFTLECKKNNISVKEGVFACAFNGWVNFNPQWIINQKESNSKSSKNGKSESPSPNKAGRVNVDKAGEFLERRRKERELQSAQRTQEKL